MNVLKRLLVGAGFAAGLWMLSGQVFAQEAPDELVKRVSQGILDAVRSDKELQRGSRRYIADFVERHIMPHVDFQRTTALAVGRHWREATSQQQRRLIEEFRTLLLHTYSGAMAQINDPKLEFKPFRADPNDTDVEVRFQVRRSRGGEPVQVGYRLIKSADGWKIYDVNVLGVWLVETYKGNFSAAINNGGIDGLIDNLSEKNRMLARNGAPKLPP